MNVTIIKFVIVFSLLSQLLKAQYKISGTIKDATTKENLIGVTVYINNLKQGSATDKDGNYSIENLGAGNYLFEIKFIGYNSKVQRLTIKSDTVIDYVLSESVTELNEVVVTGVTRLTELKLSPVIIKPIDVTALNENSSTNLIDALKIIPGINQITTGAAISKPIIRGLGANRVISLYNGIRQEGQQWGDEHGIEIDEYDIDRIEIVKGPGSLMYGSDGIAGVLNFISPKMPYNEKIKTQLISNYQSNNQLIGYSLSNAGNKNGFQWIGRFSNKQASNYKNATDGVVYNSGFKEYNGSLMLGIHKKWGYSHLNLSTYNNSLNLTEGNRDSLGRFLIEKNIDNQVQEFAVTNADLKGYKIGFPHQEINHLRVLSNSYIILKSGNLNLDFAYQNNKRKEYGDVLNPTQKALFFDLTTLNYNARYNFNELKGIETSVGVNGMYQLNDNKGLEFLIPKYTILDAGVFVFSQKTFKKLTLAGGLRFETRALKTQALTLDSVGKPTSNTDSTTTQKFKSLNKTFTSFSGSIGLSYQLTQSATLKLNASRGFRAPNISEISSNGKHEGSFRYEYGSANLKPEISHQFDVAYYYNSEHVVFEVTPFVNFISNFIYTQKIESLLGGDSIPDLSDPTPAFKFAHGNATLFGTEVYLDLHPHPLDWLHVANSFSFVQATQNNQPDSTKYLPFIPAAKYRGELKTQFAKIGKTNNAMYVKASIDYYFAQNKYFKAFQTETATPSYYLLNAGIGATIKTASNPNCINLFISADNLLDASYQSHLSRLKYAPINQVNSKMGVFNMGRNVSVKLILNI